MSERSLAAASAYDQQFGRPRHGLHGTPYNPFANGSAGFGRKYSGPLSPSSDPSPLCSSHLSPTSEAHEPPSPSFYSNPFLSPTVTYQQPSEPPPVDAGYLPQVGNFAMSDFPEPGNDEESDVYSLHSVLGSLSLDDVAELTHAQETHGKSMLESWSKPHPSSMLPREEGESRRIDQNHRQQRAAHPQYGGQTNGLSQSQPVESAMSMTITSVAKSASPDRYKMNGTEPVFAPSRKAAVASHTAPASDAVSPPRGGSSKKKMNKQNKRKRRESGKQKVKLSLQEFHSAIPVDTQAQNSVVLEEGASEVLWIGNIGPQVEEHELKEEFGEFGYIVGLRILRDRYCAFITFDKVEAAVRAKNALDGTIFGNQYIVINYRLAENCGSTDSAVTNPPSESLWVGNVGETVTKGDLLREFSKFGPVESVRLLRNCAFVNMMTVDNAVAALHGLQGKRLGSMHLKINFGKNRPGEFSPEFQPSSYTSEVSPSLSPVMSTSPVSFVPSSAVYYDPSATNGVDAGGGAAVSVSPQYVFGALEDVVGASAHDQGVCERCNVSLKDTRLLPCTHCICQKCLHRILDDSSECPHCEAFVERFESYHQAQYYGSPTDAQNGVYGFYT